MSIMNKIYAEVKNLIPTIRNDAAESVAALLADYSFDELEGMIPDDVLVIDGIGPKYADIIIAHRFELRPIIAADQYEAEVEVHAVRQKERQISFNQKYNPATDPIAQCFQIKDVLRGQSALDEYLVDHGFDPYEVLITFIGYIEQNPFGKPTSRETEQLFSWTKYCTVGFKARGGHTYKALFHGTNAGRKDKVIFVRDDAIETVKEFIFPHHTEEELKQLAELFDVPEDKTHTIIGYGTEAKIAAYAGLNIPGTIEIKDSIGIDIKPEEVALVPKYVKTFYNQHVDFVDVASGVVSLDTIRNVVENEFDGQELFHVSDKKLSEYLTGKTEEEKQRICRKLKQFKSHTQRALDTKGLNITTVDFHAVLRKLGVKHIKCIDGRIVNIDDIVILADESVFKGTIGENATYTNWLKYCETFHTYNHHYRVLITEHPDKPHTLPFQQLQSMVGCNSEDLMSAIKAERTKLETYREPNKAAALVGGEMSKIVRVIPALHNHKWIATREAAAYDKLRRQAMGGVLHGITHNCFLAKDPIAMLQHVAWAASDKSEELQNKFPKEEDFVTGAIPANTIVCAVRESGNEAVMSRNPSTDAQAQCVVNVKKDFGEWDWAIKWSTIVYASVNSYETTRIRGDHDGDHVCLSFDKAILNMAKSANKLTGGRLIDWEAPKTDKHIVTESSMQSYFASLTQQGQLGHWCDLLTSLVGFGPMGYNHEVACWLVMAVNVFVDAAKHGMDTIAVPSFVTEFLSLHDEAGNILTNEYDKPIRRPMPIYAMQEKDNAHPMAEKKRVGSDRCANAYGKGNGDILAYYIDQNTDKTLHVDIGNIPAFNVNDLLYDYKGTRNNGRSFGLRGCDDLFYSGKYNKETDKYEDQGLWKQIAYERAHELKELRNQFAAIDDDRFAYHAARKNANKFRRYVGIKRLTEWAEAHGKTIEDVYDSITFYTMNLLKYPTLRKNENNEEFEKRVMQYNIMFEAWIAIFAGMGLRAIHLQKENALFDIDDDEEVDAYDAYDEAIEELV